MNTSAKRRQSSEDIAMRELLSFLVLLLLCVCVVKACDSIDDSKSIGDVIGKNVKDFKEATK